METRGFRLVIFYISVFLFCFFLWKFYFFNININSVFFNLIVEIRYIFTLPFILFGNESGFLSSFITFFFFMYNSTLDEFKDLYSDKSFFPLISDFFFLGFVSLIFLYLIIFLKKYEAKNIPEDVNGLSENYDFFSQMEYNFDFLDEEELLKILEYDQEDDFDNIEDEISNVINQVDETILDNQDPNFFYNKEDSSFFLSFDVEDDISEELKYFLSNRIVSKPDIFINEKNSLEFYNLNFDKNSHLYLPSILTQNDLKDYILYLIDIENEGDFLNNIYNEGDSFIKYDFHFFITQNILNIINRLLILLIPSFILNLLFNCKNIFFKFFYLNNNILYYFFGFFILLKRYFIFIILVLFLFNYFL
jgi:hypothetical protein